MEIKNVVVIGGGVLGSQIAYQAAYCGFDVTIWLRSESSVERAKPRIEELHRRYAEDLGIMNTPAGKSPYVFARGLASDPASFTEEVYNCCMAKNDAALANLKYETDLAKAVADADLVIESMAENPQQKIDFYTMMADKLPEKTVIVTNSSTLLPSTFAEYTGRPEKYLALHFANTIWKKNTAEVMAQSKTNPELLQVIAKFAADIKMVPLVLNKEQPGYLLNTMLVPLLNSAMYLWAAGVSDYQTVDLCWKLGTGALMGPFQILDIVGLTTAYNISMMKPGANDPTTPAGMIAAKLKERIDAGKLGVETKEGFYKY